MKASIPAFFLAGAIPKERVGDVLEMMYLSGAKQLDIRPILPDKPKKLNGAGHQLTLPAPEGSGPLAMVIQVTSDGVPRSRQEICKLMLATGQWKRASVYQSITRSIEAGRLVERDGGLVLDPSKIKQTEVTPGQPLRLRGERVNPKVNISEIVRDIARKNKTFTTADVKKAVTDAGITHKSSGPSVAIHYLRTAKKIKPGKGKGEYISLMVGKD